jgi:site-specific DNA-methyltransferase (adenine-specific)
MVPYYDQDGIVIYHADCRDVLPALPPVDLMLTDPPYGVNLGKTKGAGNGHGLLRLAYSSYKDTFENLIGIVIPAIRLGLTKSTRAIVFCAGQHICEFPKPSTVGGLYFPAAMGRNAWGYGSCALALFNGPGCRIELGSRPTMISITSPSEVNGHPCPKPLGAMKWAVNLGSEAGNTVIDPFMGSGTTLRAAKDLGRKAIGIEIEERYCEIAANRLRQGVLDFGDAGLNSRNHQALLFSQRPALLPDGSDQASQRCDVRR